MPPLNNFQNYIVTVCNQVRCKRAHDNISTEIENHLIDQREDFLAKGMDEETATLRAIEQMGDPILIGGQLDRIHRSKPEWSIFLLTILLLLVGILTQYFIASFTHYDSYVLSKQMYSIVIGFMALMIIYFIDYTIISKYPKTVYGVFLFLSLLILLFSPQLNGKLINVFYMSLLFVPVFSGIVYSNRGGGIGGIFICGISFCAFATICYLSANMTPLLMLIFNCLTILTVAICKNWFQVKKVWGLLFVYIPTVIVFVISFFSIPNYRKDRLVIWLREPDYITTTIHEILSKSQFVGPANIYKFQGPLETQLPAWRTDTMLTYVIGKFGMIFGGIIISLIAIFIVRMFIVTLKQKSSFGFFIALATTLVITSQAVNFIAFNLGFTLLSSTLLPLVSYGSYGIIANMCIIGLFLSAFRSNDIIVESPIRKTTNPLVQFQDGKLIIHFFDR